MPKWAESEAVRTERRLRREWGPAEYDGRMAKIAALVDTVERTAPGFKEMLGATGLGNSAELIRFLWARVERKGG